MKTRIINLLNDDGLLFVLFWASMVAHFGLGWLNIDSDESPYLPNRQSGRTSVNVQLIAMRKPVELNARARILPETHDVIHRKAMREHVVDSYVVPDQHEKRQYEEPKPNSLAEFSESRQRRDLDSQVVHASAEAEIPDANAEKDIVSRESVGADVPPSKKTNPDPRYPPDLLISGIEADVFLIATVGRSGRVVALDVHKSSGYEAMDQSAMDTVKNWEFVPAKRNGVAIAKRVIVPINFRIRR